MDLLTDLNPQQRKAVTASDGPVLVLAGPGSGKTRVITHRVAWLVLERDVAPWRIMAVTFTNKAAREMRERLQSLLGPSRARDLVLGTFHATCARILRREAEPAGISKDYVIFDMDDQRRVVKQALRELALDDKQYRPQAVLGAISRAKNELVTPDAYDTGSYYGEVVRRLYERYQMLLQRNNALDFDDLLMLTVKMFRSSPKVLAAYQERYRYMLVDEFQDTNQAQYALLDQISQGHNNLFCVADEDQSIYAWRGADYRNIRRLRNSHPDLLAILLEQNYRSTQTILDAARAVIQRNTDRTDKTLFTDRGVGTRISVREFYDPNEEAGYVIDTIKQLAVRGEYSPGHCAIMYRTNAQSRAIEDAFLKAGLPYRLVGATRFYGRREIKDVIGFLRLVHNPSDGVSMARVINLPPRGIGAKTISVVEAEARRQDVSIHDLLSAGPLKTLGSRARSSLLAFTELLSGWATVQDDFTVVQLMDRILQDTRFSEYLQDGTEEGEERWANVLELRNVAAEFADISLGDFLNEVALVSEVDNLSNGVDAPTLLTLHAAKGLEFPVVFMVGLEEGVLPHIRSLEDHEQCAEERRLMYVGMTRAKDCLYLSHVFMRPHYGSRDPSMPSRFLDDIPPDLVLGARKHTVEKIVRQATSWSPRAEADRPSGPKFRAGQRVKHTAFGEGLVIQSPKDGSSEVVTVMFEGAGLKRLMASMAPLEIIPD